MLLTYSFKIKMLLVGGEFLLGGGNVELLSRKGTFVRTFKEVFGKAN